MSEATRQLPDGDAEDKGSILKTLRRWISPQSGEAAETVRDVIEELIEERNEESPSDGGPVIDPNEQWTVKASEFRSRSRNTPFDGKVFTGRVIMTLVDGEIRYQKGV